MSPCSPAFPVHSQCEIAKPNRKGEVGGGERSVGKSGALNNVSEHGNTDDGEFPSRSRKSPSLSELP